MVYTVYCLALPLHINMYPMYPFTEFNGLEVRSAVIFNLVEQLSLARNKEEEDDSELKGPVVRTQCRLLVGCCV